MANSDFLTMAIDDIVSSQPNLQEFAKPAIKIMAATNFQRALTEAYRQHQTFLRGWVAEQTHACDHDLLTSEHKSRIRGLFTTIGVGETTTDLLIDSEFSSKPLAMTMQDLTSPAE